MLNRNSSQMCGRWYLPIFLFRDGSLILIYRASFDGSHEVLVLSPHYFKIFYADVMTSGVMMVKYGGWGLLVFFEPLSKISGGFPYIFLITLHPVTFVPIYDSTLFHQRIFILGSHQETFDGITSFEVHLYSIFLTGSFEAFSQSFVIWHHYVVFFWVAIHAALFCLLLWAGVLIFIFTLLIAHSGYLHLVRTFFRCCSSFCSNSGLELMVFAL